MDAFRPHVIMGASKGGVYIVGLWRRGYWRGPTVLINAHPTCRQIPEEANVVVAVGSNDEVFTVWIVGHLVFTVQAIRQEVDATSQNSTSTSSPTNNESRIDSQLSPMLATVTLRPEDTSRITLGDRAHGGTIIQYVNCSCALKPLEGSHLMKIGPTDVSNLASFSIAPLWAKLLNHSGAYTISVEPPRSRYADYARVASGFAPALVALVLALYALPLALHQLWCHTALSPVSQAGGSEAASEAGATSSVASWVRHNSAIPLEQVEEELQLSMEPAQKMQDIRFTMVMDKCFAVQLSLLYFTGKFFASAFFTLPLVQIVPKFVIVTLMESLLQAVSCGCVFHGLKQTAASPLARPGAKCPTKVNIKLASVLNEQLFKTMVAYGIVLANIMIAIPRLAGFLVELSNLKRLALEDSAFVINVLNDFLLKMLFFRFMLDASLQARMVRLHVEAALDKVLSVHKQTGTEATPSHEGRIDTQKMKTLHAYIVKLVIDVLPCLATIGMPAAVFVVCSWVSYVLFALKLFSGSAISQMEYGTIQAILVEAVAFELPAVACLFPLTAVSDACDELRIRLNTLRAVSGADDDKHIRMTEVYMQQENNGQGMGFVMYGTGMVVNKGMDAHFGTWDLDSIVYPVQRPDLEALMHTGGQNKTFLYWTADSGRLPSGQISRQGDTHNQESLLHHDVLPRLIDATLCKEGPEMHFHRTWKERLSRERNNAELWLGYSPEQIMRLWSTNGHQSGKHLHDVPMGTEEYRMVNAAFKALPIEQQAYILSPPETWAPVRALRIQRVENGPQGDASWKPYYKSLLRSLEDQGVEFEPGTHTCWAFHGCNNEALESIVNNPVCGFQPLASGTRSTTLWGSGTYFARDAKYVADGGFCGAPNADGTRRIGACAPRTSCWR
ncbi:PARP10 [Symbiodinium sp. CCMP2592]|nr:PARP10 [Symbiodinium sp. CCMP2592]